jgi:AraC-like DNA-binding protein
MRFNDYLNLVRVNRAKFMLQNYSMTLKEIAANCCYTDTAYFCRVFKKISKVTPTEYRARNLASKPKARITALRLATVAAAGESAAEKVT